MTRKRAIKLLMALGFSRNEAAYTVKHKKDFNAWANADIVALNTGYIGDDLPFDQNVDHYLFGTGWRDGVWTWV